MKPWRIALVIIVILALVFLPALAISKSDLISYYKGLPVPSTLTPTPVQTPLKPSWYPTLAPTPVGPIDRPLYGSISITSNPSGARVLVDGTLFGVTPIVLGQVSAKSRPCEGWCWGSSSGIHQVQLTKTGYKDYTTSVTVLEGTMSTVTATLVPVEESKGETIKKPVPTPTPAVPWTGTLSVTSAPSGAPVYFDGIYKGITPLDITGIGLGPHRVRVTLGGMDYSTIVTWGKVGWEYQQPASRSPWFSPHYIQEYPLEIHVTSQGIEFFDADDIPIYKPNIYLYSDRDLTARVRLAPEDTITVSEPVYQPGI